MANAVRYTVRTPSYAVSLTAYRTDRTPYGTACDDGVPAYDIPLRGSYTVRRRPGLKKDGLVAKVRRAFDVSRDEAATAVDRALGETIQYVDEPRGGHGGGKPVRLYILKGARADEF